MGSLLKIFLPYTLLVGVGVAIWVSCNRPGVEPIILDEHHDPAAAAKLNTEAAGRATRQADPICHMDVNPAWGFEARYKGKSYFFCSKRCRTLFAENPEAYIGDRCVVCRKALEPGAGTTATYMDNTYRFCSEAHRRQFKADPAAFFMHTMWGIPPWMYYGSIAFVLVVSFGLFESAGRWRPRRHGGTAPARSVGAAASASVEGAASTRDRLDLLRLPGVRRLFASRFFRFVCQALFVAIFGLIIAAGLFGSQNPGRNIAPILTWTIWWGGLVVLIMFAGKAWCYVCPWDAVAGWLERLRFWKKADEGCGLDLPWPRMFRNILIATVLFVGLTWVELGFGVTMKPRMTAYLGLAMLLMAIASALLFQRKSFCRYGCLVGRVSGLYAMFSGIEVRARDRRVCRQCRGKPCVRGTDDAYGCPTFLYPGRLSENTYCIQCAECLQTCPKDNIALNLRPWASDLATDHRGRADEAYLALLMLSITAFHGLTMTARWGQLTAWLREGLSLGHMIAFSVGMALLMLGPIAIYAVLVAVSYRLGASRLDRRRVSYHDYFVRYAYALLPIALFYHLAHNLEHLLMEGPKAIALASDPFGWRWNLFGTLDWNIPPLVSLDVLWILQIALVLVGHVYSLWVAGRTSTHVFGDRKRALASQVPLLAGMILFSVFSLWLLKQPMEMRTSAM